MRKSFGIFMALALLLGMFNFPAAAAAPVSYSSNVFLTNLSASDGLVTFTYYNPDGTPAATIDDSIKASETKIYDPLQPQVPGGFKGSLVLSSSVPLASISNIRGLDGSSKTTHFASFDGFSAGSGNVFIPLLMRNNYGYTTSYAVQNLGGSDANISIAYSDGQTASITGLKPGASATIDQISETHTANTTFSAILTTTGSIAATVMEYGNTLLSYNGFGAGLVLPSFPIVNANNFTYWSSILIQNAGTQDTTVTVSYTPTKAGAACTGTQTILKGKAVNFAEGAFTFAKNPPVTTDCAFGARFVGSGRVTVNSASQPLVAVVNQLSTSDNKGGAYGGFDQNAGTATIVFPIIHDRNFGFWTSWAIINNGAADIAANAIDCTVTGKDKTGTAVSIHLKNPSAVPQNSGWLQDNINVIADGFVGGAICTGPTGSKLIGTVNQLGQGSNWTGIDSLLVYEGINN